MLACSRFVFQIWNQHHFFINATEQRNFAMKKSLYFLLSTTLLLNASLVIAQTTTITVTGYPAPPSSTANYYQSMVGPSGAELQQQQAAIAARVAYEKAKAEELRRKECETKAATADRYEADSIKCQLGAQTNFTTLAAGCTSVTKTSIGGSATGNIGGSYNYGIASATASGSGTVNGSVEWNPNATCRQEFGDQRDTKILECKSTAADQKATLAAKCP